MSVHCIEIISAKDVDEQKVKNKIAELISKYGEKLPKGRAPFKKIENEMEPKHYRGMFRVTMKDKNTERNDLTEQIEKELDKSASWWRVRWHECDHDQEEGPGCSWEYENSSGEVKV